jgi:NitT/TauT family transport system substrate-binding protein
MPTRRLFVRLMGLSAVCSMLAACGGSGGQSSPTPTPLASAAQAGNAPAPDAQHTATPKLTKVRFVYPVMNPPWVPFFLAKDLGIFDKYGLDVDLALGIVSQEVQAVLAGEADIAGFPAEAVVNAVAGGAPVVMVGSLFQETVGVILGAAAIGGLRDLNAKTMAVSQRGGVEEYGIRRALATAGLTGEDVSWITVLDSSAVLAAVEANQAQACFVAPPFDTFGKNAGLHQLLDLGDLHLPYVQAALFLTRDYLARNRALVGNFLKATVEGIHAMKADRDTATATFIKYSNQQDQQLARSTVDWAAEAIGRVPVVSADGLNAVLEVVRGTNPAAASVGPANVLDASLTDEIQASDLVQRLYDG